MESSSVCEFCKDRASTGVYFGLGRCSVCRLRHEIQEAEQIAARLPALRAALAEAELASEKGNQHP